MDFNSLRGQNTRGSAVFILFLAVFVAGVVMVSLGTDGGAQISRDAKQAVVSALQQTEESTQLQAAAVVSAGWIDSAGCIDAAGGNDCGIFDCAPGGSCYPKASSEFFEKYSQTSSCLWCPVEPPQPKAPSCPGGKSPGDSCSGTPACGTGGGVYNNNCDCVAGGSSCWGDFGGSWPSCGYGTCPDGTVVCTQSDLDACTPQPPDRCPNIAGNQSSVPAGMTIDANGNCVSTPPPPSEPTPPPSSPPTTPPPSSPPNDNITTGCAQTYCQNGIQYYQPNNCAMDPIVTGTCGVTPLPPSSSSGPDLSVTFDPLPDEVERGDALEVCWNITSGSPGDTDWLGFFQTADPNSAWPSRLWWYENAEINDCRIFSVPPSSALGNYHVRYLIDNRDDGSADIAQSEIVRVVETVSAPQPPQSSGSPACSDTLDNDGDSFIDYPDDPGCTGPSDDSEEEAQLEIDAPSLVSQGAQVEVSWSATGIQQDSCEVTGDNGDGPWSGESGTQTTSPLSGETRYTLMCLDPDGNDVITNTVIRVGTIREE